MPEKEYDYVCHRTLMERSTMTHAYGSMGAYCPAAPRGPARNVKTGFSLERKNEARRDRFLSALYKLSSSY